MDSAGVPCSEVIDLNQFCEMPAPDGAKHTLHAVAFYHNRHYIACRRHGERWIAYNDERMYLLAHQLVSLADLGAPGLSGQSSRRPAAPPPCPCLPAGWSAWLTWCVPAPQHMHCVPGLSDQASRGPHWGYVYQSMASACEYELFAEPLEEIKQGITKGHMSHTFLLWDGACCLDITHVICFTPLLVLQMMTAMEEGWLVHSAMYVRQGVDPAR